MNKNCKNGEEEEEDDNNNKSPAAAPAATWSELPLDLLGEVKQKLVWGDHVRFSSVCKSWLAAQHAKRACDALPWLLVLDHDNRCRISYYMCVPSVSRANLVYSHDFDISPFCQVSFFRIPCHITYHHGCLLVSTDDKQGSYSHFSLFSLATLEFIKLPRLNWLVARTSLKFFTAVSSNPTAPDCVFLALHIDNDHNWHISTFRHGDTRWTTKVYEFGRFRVPDVSCVEDVVFIRGVFYFLFLGGRLGSYEVATMKLNVDYFSNTNNLRDISKFYKFFVLDEELVVAYYDGTDHCKFCSGRFDWSQKDWVPLNSLGDRSLYLSKHSVFMDTINYDGLSLVREDHRNWFRVLENEDEISIWVQPPDLLVEK